MEAHAQEAVELRSVTVSASGRVAADPDAARVQSGVLTEAATARGALDANSAASRNLIDGLKALGIAAKDIETTQFSINPRYEHRPNGGEAVLTGYQVVNQVQVMVRDLKMLGDLLDRMVSLGANQMNGLTFEVSDAETLRDAARQDAMKNALRRAKLYAEAAGASVGEVIAISEETAHLAPGPRLKMGRAMAAEAVPVEAGQQALEARVTVTWALK
ncbi:MAG: SIMPL domain-containing protein [Hyphomicrobiaceae bacterium]|nr:SIMPL domain-containing protein [Hyphomicrobiaceae bacterium]